MEQAFEEGKRKEQFMTSDGAVRYESDEVIYL